MPISSLPLPSDEEPPDSSSQVAWLRSLGDREALFQIMDEERRSIQGLQAAEALAELGDVRGLDHLVAVFRDARSGMRMEAAEILQDLGHPRGLRALREQQTDKQSSGRAAEREAAYEDLTAATTDELMAIWHQHDDVEWSEMEFEVIETILTERLGTLPRRRPPPDKANDVDDEVDPRIQQLWKEGDSEGLRSIMQQDPKAALRLEAAEALADLGDEDGLDFLIDMLDQGESEQSEMAAEMLDWLDVPRGNAALRERGYAFETDAGNVIEAQPRPKSTSQPEPPETWTSRVPSMPGQTTTPRPQDNGASSTNSVGILLSGAAGGVIGFLFTSVGLDLLGMKALPDALRGWLEPAMVYGMIESLVVGAVAGNVGRRIVQATATRDGEDVEEQDARLVLGALSGGAICVAAVEVLRFLFSG